VQVEEVPELTNSLTQNAKQKNWKTPTEFPCCPKEIGRNPIISYFTAVPLKVAGTE
jgi:hypothetical protein